MEKYDIACKMLGLKEFGVGSLHLLPDSLINMLDGVESLLMNVNEFGSLRSTQVIALIVWQWKNSAEGARWLSGKS